MHNKTPIAIVGPGPVGCRHAEVLRASPDLSSCAIVEAISLAAAMDRVVAMAGDAPEPDRQAA